MGMLRFSEYKPIIYFVGSNSKCSSFKEAVLKLRISDSRNPNLVAANLGAGFLKERCVVKLKKACYLLGFAMLLSIAAGCENDVVQNPPSAEVAEVSEVAQQANQNVDNRSIILMNDNTNDERNLLLSEDIEYFGSWIAENHKNPFENISEQEFEENIRVLSERVGELGNVEVFTEMKKILASIGDSHTDMNYWNGYIFPAVFEVFDGDLYIINAYESYEDALYTKVIGINGHSISYIFEQLATIIPHENEAWLFQMMPQYVQAPVYMQGLGLIPGEQSTSTVFTLEKENGDILEKEFDIYYHFQQDRPDYILSYDEERHVYLYNSEREGYYWYTYLGGDDKAVYFKYNVCTDMNSLSFEDFSREMFDEIKDKPVEKFIIDLRHNAGGNSEIIRPFLQDLKDFIDDNPETEIFVAIGSQTYSSGLMALFYLENEFSVTTIGQPTGGSPNAYGEVKSAELPNSKLPFHYSVKYFQFTDDGAKTVIPDVMVSPTIEDFKNNDDIVLKHIMDMV